MSIFYRRGLSSTVLSPILAAMFDEERAKLAQYNEMLAKVEEMLGKLK